MSFVSYAQNFEDVMLWRALKHVQNGVYVDVGAQHPVVDSVSKAFYELGWRGIHIEPVLEYAALLRKDRPDETVLQVALADVEGTLELNVIPDTGLSTAVDAYAQRHQMEQGFGSQRIHVPVLTLKSALKPLAGKDVHWLKIDVEGFEEQVLKGWDSQILRPWVMVVEATIPNSPEADYASWDPILTAADYQFVYFDGLNRFYVAKEHAELAEAFSCPPNVFDGVQLSGLASSELCRGLIAAHQASEKELSTQAEARTARLEVELDSERQRTVQLGSELQAVREHESRLQAHAEWLQSEWDAAKGRVEALSQRTVQLGDDLQTVIAHESSLQAHAKWLQNEWNAAKARVDELNHSSHHWWSVADGLSRELQSVYASKSWRITLPLRKNMMVVKWALALLARSLRGVLRLPKRMVKPLVVRAMRKTFANPGLKARALSVLAKCPQLKLHLRLLALRAGLILDSPVSPMVTKDQSVTADDTSINLAPRVARIYADLKQAVEERNS